MNRYYAFNGDADGLCALQQLCLVETGVATLVTGVKRDIRLLERVDAAAGDEVTVLDISLDQNRAALLRLLGSGAVVRYFDHHYAGELPQHPRFEAHIEEAGDVCTSVLVDRYLHGRHRAWAIVAAFGDGLPKVAAAMAGLVGLSARTTSTLETLGISLNYNAYGDSVSDLHIDPAELAREMRPFEDPQDFVRHSPTFARLASGYDEDMRKARMLMPTQTGARRDDVGVAERTLGKARHRRPGERTHPGAPRERHCYTLAQRARRLCRECAGARRAFRQRGRVLSRIRDGRWQEAGSRHRLSARYGRR